MQFRYKRFTHFLNIILEDEEFIINDIIVGAEYNSFKNLNILRMELIEFFGGKKSMNSLVREKHYDTQIKFENYVQENWNFQSRVISEFRF